MGVSREVIWAVAGLPVKGSIAPIAGERDGV
jgi:hypothetical protein